MANTFYQPGQFRATKVQDLFSAIAPRYDLINDLQSFGLHRLWKRRLIGLSGARESDWILDVCCGTGDIAFRLRRTGANVVAVDFSGPMLGVASARGRKARSLVYWVNGDALHLPFPSAQFHVATISYGLRNLADIQAGLRELVRVLRPGGRLLILDFGKPRARWLRAAYFAYLQHCVPLFGRALCGDAAPYAYILESLRDYPAQEGVAALTRQLGCEEIRVFNLLGGIMSINCAEKPDARIGR
jgi:demethylmenaquinone methyltransferase/2-methoxy-6-polyprenyl-1,4-benzoquinol methylase